MIRANPEVYYYTILLRLFKSCLTGQWQTPWQPARPSQTFKCGWTGEPMDDLKEDEEG